MGYGMGSVILSQDQLTVGSGLYVPASPVCDTLCPLKGSEMHITRNISARQCLVHRVWFGSWRTKVPDLGRIATSEYG